MACQLLWQCPACVRSNCRALCLAVAFYLRRVLTEAMGLLRRSCTIVISCRLLGRNQEAWTLAEEGALDPRGATTPSAAGGL